MKFMPLMFGIFGFSFPAGLVCIGPCPTASRSASRRSCSRAGHIGPDALDRRMAEQQAKNRRRGRQARRRRGSWPRMMERAEQARQQQPGTEGQLRRRVRPRAASKGTGAKGGPRKPPPKNQPRPKPKKPGGTDGS